MTKDQRHALYHRLSVGCRVGYSARFVRNTGMDYDIGQRRGTVTEVGLHGGEFVRVAWDDPAPEESGLCHRSNVANVNSVAFREA